MTNSCPSLVFIPGMMCTSELYRDVLPLIASSIPVKTVEIPNVTSITDMAIHIDKQIEGEYVPVGLSMGGIIALELYRLFSHRIAGLGLLNTTANADNPVNRPIRLKQMKLVRAGKLKEVLTDQLMPMYLSPSNEDSVELKRLVLDMAMEVGPDAFINQSIALLEREENWEVLEGIPCTTYIGCGVEDRLCLPELHQKMGQIANNSIVEMYKDCGHLSALEAPERVAKGIEAFYSTLIS